MIWSRDDLVRFACRFTAPIKRTANRLGGPSQKSGQILSLKYAFTLGNENGTSYQSPEEEGMH